MNPSSSSSIVNKVPELVAQPHTWDPIVTEFHATITDLIEEVLDTAGKDLARDE